MPEIDASVPRLALVGFGRWGRVCHAPLIHGTGGLRLQAVVSGSAEKREKARRDFGCETFETFEQALADPAVDAVVLATPADTHAGMAIQALEAGKHVVVDKPMCLTLDEADRMIAAAKATGRVLTVFQNRRLDGDFLTVRSLLSEGQLGDLRWVEMAWQGFGPWGGWRGQASRGGGRFRDLGAHLIDQLLLLIDSPVESAWCRMRRDFEESDTDSEALLVVAFQNGATGVIDTSSLSALPKPRFYLRGTGATFRKWGLDPQEDALLAAGERGEVTGVDAVAPDPANDGELRRAAVGTLKHVPTDVERIPTQAGRWRTFYENLRDVLNGTAEPLVRPEQVRRVIAIMDAAERSAESGRAEPVDGE